MKIGTINTSDKVLIIAEVGNNHEGSIDEAKKLIRAAAEAGANAVKFQTIVPDLLVSSDQTDRLNQLGRYAFSKTQFLELKKEADQLKVIFLSTPFDLDSVDFLNPIVPAFKIASGDSNFKALLQKLLKLENPYLYQQACQVGLKRSYFVISFIRFGGNQAMACQGYPFFMLL